MIIIVITLCNIVEVLWACKLIGTNDLQTKIFHFDITEDRVPYFIYFSLLILNHRCFYFSLSVFFHIIICDIHFPFLFLNSRDKTKRVLWYSKQLITS